MRANVQNELELQAFWKATESMGAGLHNSGPIFALHDGLYANGALHMGHALNKVLKDVINKYQVMQGRRALRARLGLPWPADRVEGAAVDGPGAAPGADPDQAAQKAAAYARNRWMAR